VRPGAIFLAPEPPVADQASIVTNPSNDFSRVSPTGYAVMRAWGLIMDVVVWLRSLGLGKYEAAFRENGIDETVLPGLTRENLKELGVTSATGRKLAIGDHKAPIARRADCIFTCAQPH
jgi:SAM domain (Sterile alpha motif)